MNKNALEFANAQFGAANAYLTLSEIAAIAPGRPHMSAVWRWCRKGIKARNGQRIKLTHIRAGARVFVPEGALAKFLRELEVADAEHFDARPEPKPEIVTLPKPSDRQRERDLERTRQKLRRAGVL